MPTETDGRPQLQRWIDEDERTARQHVAAMRMLLQVIESQIMMKDGILRDIARLGYGVNRPIVYNAGDAGFMQLLEAVKVRTSSLFP